MRLLICKDAEQNTLLESRELKETDNIQYSIIDNAPVIEEKEGYDGFYKLDKDGNVIVVYEEKPKTQLDIIQEQLSQLINTANATHADGLINMDIVVGIDEKLS